LSKIVNLNEKATMKWFTNRRYKFRNLNKQNELSEETNSNSNSIKTFNENNDELPIFYEIID
jgi:pantothenate kinase